MPWARRVPVPSLLLGLGLLVGPGPATAQSSSGVVPDLVVDYGPIVDRGALTHSGQTVGEVLDLLGRPEGDPARGPQTDAALHMLVDPLLEPYAHVLADVVASGDPAWSDRVLVEPASLYAEGEPQPAWVDLARTRRYVVLSDGAGNLRLFLPGPDVVPAWRSAYPALRPALLAERARLGAGATLHVEAFAYAHDAARSTFSLHRPGTRLTLDALPPPPGRPPLDLEALARFLGAGLQIEGARLTTDGGLVLSGTLPAARPTLGGRPLELADLATAYRAVFHADAGTPYMSLDRSPYPEYAVVNYGGRLRDTRIGLVSLLCDIRFKTFSQGFDFITGDDVRGLIRETLPEFRTHMERFAAAEAASQVTSQQTRLWFYPDAVDLHVSPSGDLLVVRRARMAAAAERFTAAGVPAPEEPPWTRDTTASINLDYERMAGVFPELGELDTVARLLSLFSWLRELDQAGWTLPDLDALLAVPLPAGRTPRGLPQLVVLSVLDRASGEPLALSVDRSGVADRMLRLRPTHRADEDPATRLRLALSEMPVRLPDQARAAERFRAAAATVTDDADRRALAYEVERFIMHNRAIYEVDRQTAEAVVARERAGGILNVFSTAIGGLDLDMSGAVRSAWQQGAEAPSAPAAPPVPEPPEGGWGDSLERFTIDPLPEHGRWATREIPAPGGRLRTREAGAVTVREMIGKDGELLWRRATVHPRTTEERVLEMQRPAGAAVSRFLRCEGGRCVRYTFEPRADRAVAVRLEAAAPDEGLPPVPSAPVSGAADTVWDLLPSDLPLLAVEGSIEPTVLLGDRSLPEESWRARAPGRPDATGRAAVALLDAAARARVTGVREPSRGLAHLALDPDRRQLVVQTRGGTGTVGLEAVRALMLGAPGASSALPDLLRPVGPDVVIYRDSAASRPLFRGPGLRPRPEEDPVRLMAALNASREGLTVSLTTDPERGAHTAVPPARKPEAWSAVLLDERWPDDHREALRAASARLRAAGIAVGDALLPASPATTVVLTGGEGSAVLAARLRALGRTGALEGRTLLVLPLNEPLDPGLADELIVQHRARAVLLTAEALDPVAVEATLAALPEVLADGGPANGDPVALLWAAAERASARPSLGRRSRDEILRLLRSGLAL